LQEIRRQGEVLQSQEQALKAQVYAWKAEAVALERAKGDHFRQRLFGEALDRDTENSILADRRERFDKPIAEFRRQVREALIKVRRLYRERKALERSEEAITARERMGRIAAEAMREKAHQAQNALQTVNGLPHTNCRPSSWWFPVVDPSGAWLRRVAATAHYYLEGAVSGE
jgi:hypothetical protein